MSKKSALWLLLTMSVSSVPAFATSCLPNGGGCPIPQYETDYQHTTTNGSCPSLCKEPTEAPTPALINCEYGSRQFTCEAWPDNPDNKLVYMWSTTGNLRLMSPNNSTNPIMVVNCGSMPSGKLTVNVASPYHLTAPATVTLTCQ